MFVQQRSVQRHKSQRGSALVEMALGATVLIYILIGVIDYGPVFYNTIELDSGARAGAVYGSQSIAHATDLQGMQNQALANILNIRNVTATASEYCECPGVSGTQDCAIACPDGSALMVYAKVTTQWTYQPTLRYPYVAYPMIVTRTAIMRAQ